MSNWLYSRALTLARAGSPSAGTIMINFDGVIHDQNDGWRGGEVYGPPIPGALEELQFRSAGGWSLAIVTARHHDQHPNVARWVEKHTGLKTVVCAQRHAYWQDSRVLVTNVKPGAVAYVADNAVRFDQAAGGWATALSPLPYDRSEILSAGRRG
ncbi:hypothetical protein [Kitasatospora sp. MBT63]|uniref:hypothetical protein n=1 Tax=Kitasatospora sp. MBT63 TaxID=1444768 RepID=UPI00053A7EAC|nr:hypothetical protein [Kitasatospora sp. MBT63]